jgi:monoamine oxidase
MCTKTLIIGGGLTGLSLAYRLQKAGHDYLLIEARQRLGGRIKSLRVQDAQFDLGPSWIWSGQNRVAELLAELRLTTFEQWSVGAQLYEHPNGNLQQSSDFMSMAGSYRIAGGTTALTDALAAKLDPDRIRIGSAATMISADPLGAHIGSSIFTAERIVLAIPPRIAADLDYSPALPDQAQFSLRAIPTWMGAHAKFVAVYPTPFWRNDGLSGDASSRRGPLVEIHDAGPDNASLGALFGFVGIPADARANSGAALSQAAIAQLVNLFGAEAGNPITTQLEDWSQADFTASPADANPPAGHPPYQMPSALRQVWNDRLIFATTELTCDNGGLIEGALAASEAAADRINRA